MCWGRVSKIRSFGPSSATLAKGGNCIRHSRWNEGAVASVYLRDHWRWCGGNYVVRCRQGSRSGLIRVLGEGVLVGEGDGFSAILGIDLGVKIREVTLDGAHAEEK